MTIWDAELARTGNNLAKELDCGFDCLHEDYEEEVRKALDAAGFFYLNVEKACTTWRNIRKAGPRKRVERLSEEFREFGTGTGNAKPGAKLKRELQHLLALLDEAKELCEKALEE